MIDTVTVAKVLCVVQNLVDFGGEGLAFGSSELVRNEHTRIRKGGGIVVGFAETMNRQCGWRPRGKFGCL